MVDELSVATIVLESNPWHDDISQSLECNATSSFSLPDFPTAFSPDYGFSAYENSLNLQREYYQEFACEFDLVYYPFDTQACWFTIHLTHLPTYQNIFVYDFLSQVCHMVFALQGFTKEFIAMEGDGVGVEYLGRVIQGDICSCVMLQEKGNF